MGASAPPRRAPSRRAAGPSSLVARRETELRAVAERCGKNALPVVADVTRRDDVRRAIHAAIDHFGHVDVLVNNVGRGITRLPTALTDDDIDDMIRINIKSVMYGVQEILPHFKERGSGHIINVSSMLGRMPMAPFRSAYNGAKHFLNAITWNLRQELQRIRAGRHGVSGVAAGRRDRVRRERHAWRAGLPELCRFRRTSTRWAT